MDRVLIIVDVQYDFLPAEGTAQAIDGALAIPDGDKIIAPLHQQWQVYAYGAVLASMDWHPPLHKSFEANGGPWPEHCVQNTFGANLEQTVLDICDFSVYKGFEAGKEAYSAFDGYVDVVGHAMYAGERHNPRLLAWLMKHEVEAVDICGLALDYCVLATALDAQRAGLETTVLLDLTRPVNWVTGMQAIEQLVEAGVALRSTQ